MQLCETCNSANGSCFNLGQCYICEGVTAQTQKMISNAAAILTSEKAKSFSISTIIPKDWLIREERVWDERIHASESIKNALNRKIAAALRQASGGIYSSEGECRVVFDYSKNTVELQRNELFIFGRYKKISAGLSQSRWRCSKCEGKGCGECNGKGKYYESVEERIGEPLKKATGADDYVMHASGREDVDATNSAGRPFVLEIKNPKIRGIDFGNVEREIGNSNEVAVVDLRIVGRAFVEMVTESHFDKTYEADVEFGRNLVDEDIDKIRSLEGVTILQQTPKRVAHRRANLVRHRKIKHVEVVEYETQNPRLETEDPKLGIQNPKLATITIRAEAGTYIKELISGDGGRTKPSISELLNTKAECKKLNVSGMDDGFLDFCLANYAH